MQLLGNFYEYYLNNENEKINIVVATSGDTGAAAIDALKEKKILIFLFFIRIIVFHSSKKIDDNWKREKCI